jgi:hypothetical protein
LREDDSELDAAASPAPEVIPGTPQQIVDALTHVRPIRFLRIWPVDKKGGNVRNDGPDLLEPHVPSEPADDAADLLGRTRLERRASEITPLRFRNGDILVVESNERLEAATSASSHATNCTKTPHTASKPKAIPVTVA